MPQTTPSPMTLLVTGGAGFIGSALIRFLIRETDARVINLDKLTYAANLEALAAVERDPRYRLERADICDAGAVRRIFAEHSPDAVIHLAAESHVDRAIDAPADFVQTNVIGTYVLLEAALAHWRGLDKARAARFRFHHVSTDEVFGSLGETGIFTEETAYAPNSPYSASKAGSDHLVRAWHHTYGLPVVTSNCSNNYGPHQFPEKLIPLMIVNAILGEKLPVYGSGAQVRDWLYVEDHARALHCVLTRGRVGENYNIGGHNEHRNLDVVQTICDIVDELVPPGDTGVRRRLITFVADRPGHDLRYAIDASKIRHELGWTPRETFETGLRKTIAWYLANKDWWLRVRKERYDGRRLGTSRAKAPAHS